jgi:hypothetical protein
MENPPEVALFRNGLEGSPRICDSNKMIAGMISYSLVSSLPKIRQKGINFRSGTRFARHNKERILDLR